jgi:hypothetical protein
MEYEDINILTRSERNIIAHVFAGFLFNPLMDFYPTGILKVLEHIGIKPSSKIKPSEFTVAYEAQIRDLLYLNYHLPATSEVRVSNTAFDIAVKYHSELVCFEVKFLTGWDPEQINQELEDCRQLIRLKCFDRCHLVLLYPKWRKPQRIPPEVIMFNWEVIEDVCLELGGIQIVKWMRSIKVPHQIHNNGATGRKYRGLFEST